MRWGLCHKEIKIDKKGPVLIEVNARPIGLAMSALMVIGSMLIMLEDLGDPDINAWGRIICAVSGLVGLALMIWSIRRDSKRAIVSPKMLRNSEYIVVGIAFLLCTLSVKNKIVKK